MIEKITDPECLSGVSSPLLPLLYTDCVFSQNEIDGAFLQKNEKGVVQSIFSLKNACVNLHLIKTEGLEELEKFFAFCGVSEVLSDKPCVFSSQEKKELFLFKLDGEMFSANGCTSINQKSSLNEYKALYDLVFEGGNNFENWFPEFSKKINSGNAYASYLEADNKIVSGAISPAVFENTAVIAGVFTSNKYRKKGYGSECVKSVVKQLLNNNVSDIYLWCEEQNLSFYKKLAFKFSDKIYFGVCK